MALSPSLQQFKSSGVYRLEFDKSQIINIPSETIRLVIGFSKKGAFNTPVFVQDSEFFKAVFGDIDTTLERKGSFFHRTVLTCLTRGPVIVLNLLKLTDADKSQFKTISTSASMLNLGATAQPVTSYFNTDKFWFADPKVLVDFANNINGDANKKLLNLANIGRKTISIVTRKSDVLGFDILAKDWFGMGKVPEYMNDNDYISDYLIDVIVVEGDFSDYNSLAIDPIFGQYFDAKGLKKTYVDNYGFERDGLTSFLALEQVTVLGIYTGSLTPEFQSKNGENLYIQDIVNLETSKTGLLLGFDGEFLDDEPNLVSGDFIDLVGHSIESEKPTTLDFLSYYGSILESIDYVPVQDSVGPEILDSIFEINIGATPGQTGANALVTSSISIQAATGWTASAGLYDIITIYGPSATLPSGFSSAFSTNEEFSTFASKIKEGGAFVAARAINDLSTDVNYSKVISKSYSTTSNILQLQISLSVDSGVSGPTNKSVSYLAIDNQGLTAGSTTPESLYIIPSLNQTFSDDTYLYGFVDSTLYQDNLNGIITNGDRIGLTGGASATEFGYVTFDRYSDNDFSGTPFSSEFVFAPANPVLSKIVNYVQVSAWEAEDFVDPTDITYQSEFRINSLTGDINQTVQIFGDNPSNSSVNNPTTTIWLDNTANGPYGLNGYNGKILKGQYLVANFGGTGTATKLDPRTGKSRLTKIISVSEITDPTSADYKKIKVVTNEPIFVNTTGPALEVERYDRVEKFVTNYRFHTLTGYTITDSMLPNGTLQRQNEILDIMTDTGIFNALIDREVITYRYIVDSFEGGIEPSTKIRLSKLAKAQQSSLAICNMPSVKQFRDSVNPLFKFDSTSSFNPMYISTGGNLDLNPSNVFSLPGIADGSNYVAYYGPNLNIRENGSNKSIPPAAHVSNLYIDKYNLALPFSIVAGPRRGIVTGEGIVGVEYAFDRTDLDYIEPFGYNAILNKRGFGLVINANQTGQQNVKSALSQIHVRELLIYIQDGIEAILKNYRWEFNTAQNRLEIKTLADNFLTQILADGGVYDFQNIMDSTNNTAEIIDSNIGILDTYIEPVRGMGILVHRTTILKTGTIATGNFI